MNNYPNQLLIPKAQKTFSNFPLDTKTLTTSDFGKTQIPFCTELVPNDTFDINVDVLSQLAPMVVPTMGSVKLYTRAFFVPYRFVWRFWEDFFSQKQQSSDGSSVPNYVPRLASSTISSVFFNITNGLVTQLASDAPTYDYSDINGSVRYNLTYKGRLWQSILHNLGYSIFPEHSGDQIQFYSALPLLCLVKVFRDYYVNPNFNYRNIDILLNSAINSMDNNQFITALDFVSYGWFGSNLFTSAWANPEDIGYSELYKSQSLEVPMTPDQPNFIGKSTDVGYTWYNIDSSQQASGSITQFGLNLLKSLRNFTLRQNIAGGRFVDQLLSRFGIKLDDNETKRAFFIGSFVSDTQISRVDATAAGTDGSGTSQLGDFTGRGVLGGNGHFHFENRKNDFGMLFVISHLIPDDDYYQGVKPHVNRVAFHDFFNPDFENIGLAPIPYNEVFNDFTDATDHAMDSAEYSYDSVFGYAPNYYGYKTQQCTLSGDFRVNHLNAELESFQLFRKLLPASFTGINAKYGIPALLNEKFMRADKEGVAPYDRIFLDQSDDADHFIMSYFFKIRASRPMNSIGTSLLQDLKEHGNDVGDLVKVRPNGKYF